MNRTSSSPWPRTARALFHAVVFAGLAPFAGAQTLFNGRLDYLWDVGLGALNQSPINPIVSKTYYQIAAGDFAGAATSDLVMYDRINGICNFYEVNGVVLTQLSSLNWRRTWDHLVPGQYDGSGFTDLALYDRQNRELSFVRVNAGGTVTTMRSHLNQKEWDVIHSGNFGGLPAYDDLLMYSKTRGELEIWINDGAGGLTRQLQFQTGKIWDIVTVGQFDQEVRTDVLLYSKVVGLMAFYLNNGSSTLQLLRAHNVHPHWDEIVNVGRSPSLTTSDARSRLLLYDRRAGTWQVVRFTGTDNLSYFAAASASKRWTRFVTGHFGSTGWLDVLGYDNVFDLQVHAVRCSDDDGGRQNPITPAEIDVLVDAATDVYRDAGIEFHFDPADDFEDVRDTRLNSLDTLENFGEPAVHAAYHEAARVFANLRPGRITVFFRHGYNRQAGVAYSSYHANFVVMRGYVGSTTAYYLNASDPRHGQSVQARDLLAHEVGHYLGLRHVHHGVEYTRPDPHDDVIAFMVANNMQTMEDLDNDYNYLYNADPAHVYDTPPDVGGQYYLNKGWNPADRLRTIRLRSAAAGIDFEFNTDRYNVMSYWPPCDDYHRVSVDQTRNLRMRLLDPTRIRLVTSVYGDVTRYGTACGAGLLALSLSGRGDPAIGQPFDFLYSGAPGGRGGLLLLGLSRTAWGNTSLPMSLAAWGAPGCWLNADPVATSFVFTTPLHGVVPYVVPSAASLVGAHVYGQFAVFDPSFNAAGLVTSNGLDLEVGV